MPHKFIKVTVYATRAATQYKKLQNNFILIAMQVKAEFVRLAAWLSITWGSIC